MRICQTWLPPPQLSAQGGNALRLEFMNTLADSRTNPHTLEKSRSNSPSAVRRRISSDMSDYGTSTMLIRAASPRSGESGAEQEEFTGRSAQAGLEVVSAGVAYSAAH